MSKSGSWPLAVAACAATVGVLIAGCSAPLNSAGAEQQPSSSDSASPGPQSETRSSLDLADLASQIAVITESDRTFNLQTGAEPCRFTREAAESLLTSACSWTADITGAKRYEGVSGRLLLKEGKGSLYVSIERTDNGGGSIVRYRAERQDDCYSEGGLFVCPVRWKERGRLTERSFAVDEELGRARLRFRLRGRQLRLRWDGSVDRITSLGPPGGYLLLQQRESTAAGRWGGHPLISPDHRGQGLIYRRFERP